ncbi:MULTISPECIES: ABC transporter permease [unclassified Haematobacter]|uniref:ABC transporter permease n=1 Tax=unclassified Haematobacter TaxID=2640585 RepID=UPI0025BEFEA2|nr:MULTISPECIES: ABC transporter permease subunit [unclassified Haematobacter]
MAVETLRAPATELLARHAIVLCVALYVGVLSLWPLMRLFVEALAPGRDGAPLGLMRDVLTARATLPAVMNTLGVSAASVVISVVLGVALALATGLFALRGRVAMSFLALSPLIVPSQTTALAWIGLVGSGSPILGPLGLAPAPGTPNPLYSGGGIALVMGIEHMPLVFIAVRAALAQLPQDLVEAARIAGAGRGRVIARIVLPPLLPSVLAAGVLAFAAAIGNFGVPALLGIPGRFPVLTTLIYQRLNGFGPGVAGQVAVLALILVVIALAALALRALVLRRLTVPLARGAVMAPFALPPALAHLLSAGLWLLLGTIAVLPMLALLATALSPALGVPFGPETATLANFTETLANPAVRRAFANSVLLSGSAAVIVAAVAIPFAFLKVTLRDPVVRVLDWLVDAPWVVPGTVVALAMILTFLKPLPLIGSLYGTWALLLIAYLARFLPLVLRPVVAAAEAVEPALDEAARIAGGGVVARMTRITAPLLLPAAAAGGMLVMMTALNELTLSALLWSSGNETLGVMVFSLQYEGNSTGAAAVAVLSVALVLLLALMLDACWARLPGGVLPWRAA